jgi:coproporphyrinogen III oxidase-like Fe-S oxidoreductase
VRANGAGLVEETRLSAEERADEMLLMGLRTEEGVDIARVEALRARPLSREALTWLVAQNLVSAEGSRVRLTRAGRALANRIVAELAA